MDTLTYQIEWQLADLYILYLLIKFESYLTDNIATLL